MLVAGTGSPSAHIIRDRLVPDGQGAFGGSGQLSSPAFQIRIGCVLPTVFRAEVECFGPREWRIAERDRFVASINRQMGLLQEKWATATDSRIDIRYRLHVCDLTVTRISKCTKSKVYQINAPSRSSLTRSKLLNGAMAFLVWIPFEQGVYEKLPRSKREPYTDGDYMWIPCTETHEIGSQRLRKGLNHELKHWSKKVLRMIGFTVCSPHKESFWEELNQALTPNNVRLLCSKYPPDEKW